MIRSQRSRSFDKHNFCSFGLLGSQKCWKFLSIIWYFWGHHYGFTNYFRIFFFNILRFSNIIPGGVSAWKIWSCEAEAEIWSSKTYKISVFGPFWLSSDLLIVLHMVCKNQENWESSLVGLLVTSHSEMPNISSNNFFFAFLSCHDRFTNYFEILTFLFSNIIAVAVLTWKISFWD